MDAQFAKMISHRCTDNAASDDNCVGLLRDDGGKLSMSTPTTPMLIDRRSEHIAPPYPYYRPGGECNIIEHDVAVMFMAMLMQYAGKSRSKSVISK